MNNTLAICLLFFFSCGFVSKAQKPYCSASHVYQNSLKGNNNPINYVIAIEQVLIKNNQNTLFDNKGDGFSGDSACGLEYRLLNSKDSFVNLFKGGYYQFYVSSSSAYGYGASFGLFIDLNGDYDFNDSGEFLGEWKDLNNGKYKPSVLIPFEFKIPCNARLGNSRLRLVCNYNGNPVTKLHGCTSCNGTALYGETADISIFIEPTPEFSADFNIPYDTLWTKTQYYFSNKNIKNYIAHQWFCDGILVQKNRNSNFSNSSSLWNQPGRHCLQLNSSSCIHKDSIVKCIDILSPSNIPIADFVSSGTTIYQYDLMGLYDVSSYGPWKWTWNIYDSTTYATDGFYPSIASGDVLVDPSKLGLNEFSKTPQISFAYPGCYTVELTATNDIGPSVTKKKTCYINVVLPNEFNIGYGVYGPQNNNYIDNNHGVIYDNGGKLDKYSNNQGYGSRSYLCITPCSAKKIYLKFSQLKLSDSMDILKIWDGNSAGGQGTVLLAQLTKGSAIPKTLTATSGSMFILFESNSTGTDSGFTAYFETELGNVASPQPYINTSTSNIYKGIPFEFINASSNISGIPNWKWSVDKNPILVYNQDKFKFTINDTFNHLVCLEMTSCAGKVKSCQTFKASEIPAQQVSIDFKADKVRLNLQTETVVLTPLTNYADNFSWIISPNTYELLNPPSNPNNYGPGFINYPLLTGDSFPTPIIRFKEKGCYNIQLRAYNNADKKNTVRFIIKNEYICALDYCQPNVKFISQDIGFNQVELSISSNQKTIFLQKSHIESSGYSDYSLQKNKITFCENYNLTLKRNTNGNPVNVWVFFDWNADSDFDDLNEKYKLADASYSNSFNFNFTSPNLNQAYEGEIRMRVMMNYDSDSSQICGVNTSGESEDYTLLLTKDKIEPQLTLIGSDTVKIPQYKTYVDSGAIAFDNIEGDITHKIVQNNNIEVFVPGLYEVEYLVSDCSGNINKKSRIVIVYPLIEMPTLIINNNSNECIDAKRNNPTYIDPGATAFKTNPPQNLTNNIVVYGSVNTRIVGDYQLTYVVKDIVGNTSSKVRNVCVRDLNKPILVPPVDTNVEIGKIWLDPVYADDAYDRNCTIQRKWLNNKALSTFIKDVYTVTYYATDSSGNEAIPITINYRVDDFVPPTIQLNTPDVVIHDVGNPFYTMDATVSDNYYSADFISIRLIYNDVNPKKLGTYAQTYEAVDGSGNVSYKTRTVKIVDLTAPRIWANIIHGCVGENIWPMSGIKISDNYYSPQSLLPKVEIVTQNVNIWEEGIYFIVYRVTDPSGNTSKDFTRYAYFTYFPKCENNTNSIDNLIDNSLNIYPNPNQGIFRIECTDKINASDIKLFNSSGQCLSVDDYQIEGNQIDMSAFGSGIYLLQIQIGEHLISRKIVIEK
jgi:hypothetical protein